MRIFGTSPSARSGAWAVVAAATVAQVGLSTVEQGIPTLTPFVKQDLALSASTAGSLVSAFAFGKLLGLYAAGRSADVIGERRMLICGGCVTAAVVAVGSQLSFAILVVLLMIGGAASSVGGPAGGRMVMRSLPENRHGLGISVRQAAAPIGGMLAAATLPVIASRYDWRTAILVAAAVAACSVLPLWWSRPPQVLRSLSPSVARPRARLRSTKHLVALTIWGCLLISGQWTLLTFLPLDLASSGRMSLVAASSVIVVLNLVGAVARIGLGRISDRRPEDRWPVLQLTTYVSTLGMGGLCLLPETAPLPFVFVCVFASGVGLVGFQGVWLTVVAQSAGIERSGAATGMALTFGTATIVAAPVTLGALAEATGTYRSIWAATCLMAAVALVPLYLTRRRRG